MAVIKDSVVNSSFNRPSLAAWTFLMGWLWWDLPTVLALDRGKSPVVMILTFGQPADAGSFPKCLWFIVGLMLVGFSYPALCRRLIQWRRSWQRVYLAGYTALAGGSLPLLSHDLLSYIGEAQMSAVFHRNPLSTLIANIPHWRHDFWLAHAGWAHSITPYGPLWAEWETLSGHLTHPFWQQFIWIKASNVVMVLATAYLLGHRVGRARGLGFALHPLVGLELLANGHNDAALIFLMVLGYGAYQRRRYLAFALFWSLATGIKFVPLILLPILLVGLSALDQVLILTAGAAALTAMYLLDWPGFPFLLAPWSNQSLDLRSFDFILQGGLSHLLRSSRTVDRHLATLGGVLAWIVVLLERGRRFLGTKGDPIILGDLLIAFALIGLSWFQYWYLLWALPFYLLSNHPRAPRMVFWLGWVEAIQVLAWPSYPDFADREILQFAMIWLSLGVTAFRIRAWIHTHFHDLKEGTS